MILTEETDAPAVSSMLRETTEGFMEFSIKVSMALFYFPFLNPRERDHGKFYGIFHESFHGFVSPSSTVHKREGERPREKGR